MDNNGGKYLDVSDLSAPEPMQAALEMLASMPRGTYLHLHHRRYPQLLFERLQVRRYQALTRMGPGGSCEVFIWHQNDAEGRQHAQHAAAGYSEWLD